MKHRLGEPPFVSIQGEGGRCGVLSTWVRVFGCNLRCPGFGREKPEMADTYPEPFVQIQDLTKYKTVFELPIIEYGCDSLYSIDPRFKSFATDYTTETLAQAVWQTLPGGKFKHPTSGQTYDLCITGGEPMMQQKQTIALLNYMVEQDNFPYDIQIETNGTQSLASDFARLMMESKVGYANGNINWYWSISPKLHTVSGEPDSKAWKLDVIQSYWDVNPNGWVKIVVNNREECWTEMERKVAELRERGINFPVYIMPVGASKEEQENSAVVGKIANRAIQAGYHVSGRLHAILFGNGVGT